MSYNKANNTEKNYRMRIKAQIDKKNSVIGLTPLPKDTVDPDPVVHMSDLKKALEPYVTKSDLNEALNKMPEWFKIWSATVYQKQRPEWFTQWVTTDFQPLKADVLCVKENVAKLDNKLTNVITLNNLKS